MLERVAHGNGVVTYRSALLGGVVHGFTTRLGGVSGGDYATLNLGTLAKGVSGDENTSVAANFRKLRAALGVERWARAEVRQVHGAEVAVAGEEVVRPGDSPCADAIVTATPGRLLVIRTADCVPVLLAGVGWGGPAGPGGPVVAAVHAGWRGVVADVVAAAVAVMVGRFGVDVAGLSAAVGPCISREWFEVGPEVAEAMAAAGLGEAVASVPSPPGKGWPLLRPGEGASPNPASAKGTVNPAAPSPGSKTRHPLPGGEGSQIDRAHVDLAAAVALQLTRAGLERGRIDVTDRCTYRDEAEFFSHRRDVTHRGRPGTGRMAAVIGIP